MNIYSRKQWWKLLLFIAAVVIGISSLWYTNVLVKKLSVEARKKVELWAEGTKQLANINDQNQNFSFLLEVIINNETVPVILADEKEKINGYKNLDSLKALDPEYLKNQLEIMKKQHEPIEIVLYEDHKNYIYYKDSVLLVQLTYYPYIQLGVIFLFILVSYFAFSVSRKAEQNQVWVGLSKETAHQLGTPISSLIAWVELLKMEKKKEEHVAEIEKDVRRLEVITERFSKIGSTPVLSKVNIIDVLYQSINYIKSRVSSKITFNLHFTKDDEIIVPLNIALFEWVIENLCKNAIDAMDGTGTIDIFVTDQTQIIYIDIKDTGKGIPKSKYKDVFHPGYTTKERGWGLGLSLAKRIIETYHSGKIFIKSSEIDVGTVFRIALKK
ncbi:MAG: HAMP domain-containing histidine kinase [Bacteroidia bacterium]|nr:HAMP domain-containing histidine kinase [Bacteroidia bacterium]